MATVDLVIGAPAWDRAWALPLWFSSVRANVDPARTGLAFVVPADDNSTREAIASLSEGFAWVEVVRDRMEQSRREERPGTAHETLAAARNQLLGIVNEAKPDHYISWDTDFLVAEGTVRDLRRKGLPLVTSWTWLNRQMPQRIRHFDGQNMNEVWWQPPVCATAMAWDPTHQGRAIHYPAHEFDKRAKGTWQCGVTLAWQVMDRRAYGVASYSRHRDGEDVGFAWRLAERNVPKFCSGEHIGVHLYDRSRRDEIAMEWPAVMQLAKQRPLASTWTEPRSVEYEAFGMFPVRSEEDDGSSGRAGDGEEDG